MRRVIFLFLDGVGLGADSKDLNPLSAGRYPTLLKLLDGQRPVADTGRFSAMNAELVPTDAQLGINGRPQSATGQATILTGVNVPQRIGEHYGPRPDNRIRAIVADENLFGRLHRLELRTCFCNAYPDGYFEAVRRGKRLHSVLPYAALQAGQPLLGKEDYYAGLALAADFTGCGWRESLGFQDAPVYTPEEAGKKLWEIAQPYHFILFEHWMTDLLGHRRDMAGAVANFEQFDAFLQGLVQNADLRQTLIVVGSDHGNVEDCSDRRHTLNPALTLLVGQCRRQYAARIRTLCDYFPMIVDYLAS